MAVPGGLDALKLEKWEDAFQQPVASVRAMENQIRVALHEKKEGLRGLVGESYRDLLKTAERIIEMNESIQQVEGHLSQASKQCNYGYVQKKAANAVMMKAQQHERDRRNRVLAAEIAVLSNCPAAISRSLSSDSSPLLAAKLYILARLLRRSVSEKIKNVFISTLERQLSNIRVTILQRIEQEICRLDADASSILQSLGAYALITSSSSAGTFSHFQSLRLGAVTSLLENDNLSAETILEAVRLVNENLRLSNQLFPRRLSDLSSSLKIKSIFEEPAINSMFELNMGVHRHWISDSIRKYVPWLKTDDLDVRTCKSDISVQLVRALKAIFDGLEAAVKVVTQVETLVQIRHNVLGACRGIMGRTTDLEGEDLKQTLFRIREIVNTRIREVLNTNIGVIGEIGLEISQLVTNGAPKRAALPSWSNMLSTFENAKGGRNLKTMVKVVSYNNQSELRAIRQKHNKWTKKASDNYSQIKKMNEERDWNPEDDDEDDIDAPESLKDMNNTDAESLLSTYLEGLLEGYRSLEANLESVVSGLQQDEGADAEVVQPIESVCTIIRLISMIRKNIPHHGSTAIVDLIWFGVKSRRDLYILLAKGTSKKPLRSFTRDLSLRKWSSDLSFTSLWEGSPKLPVQPSPLVFKFLRGLVQSMSDVGADLWTKDATNVLKGMVRMLIWEELDASLKSTDVPAKQSAVGSETTEDDAADASGESAGATTESPVSLNRNQLLQGYFDTTYLDNALRTIGLFVEKNEDEEPNDGADIALGWEFIARTRDKVKIDADERERISRSTEDYWRRTSLLFGILEI